MRPIGRGTTDGAGGGGVAHIAPGGAPVNMIDKCDLPCDAPPSPSSLNGCQLLQNITSEAQARNVRRYAAAGCVRWAARRGASTLARWGPE